MRNMARAVAAVCGIAALVTLPPLGLLHLAGPPLPAHLPTTGDTVNRQAAIIEVTALAGWLCWTAILITAVTAAARRLPQLVRRLPHLHPPNPVRGLSAAVLGTVAVTTASSTTPPAAHATATTPLHPTAGGTLPAALSPRPATTVPTTTVPATTVPATTVPATTVPTTTVAAVASSTHLPVYQVNSGDWLGFIAERFLGDFDRYHDIQRLNPDLIQDPDLIQPKWRLILPADAYDRGARRHATGNLVVKPAAASPNQPNTGPAIPGPGAAASSPGAAPSPPPPSATATVPATPGPSDPASPTAAGSTPAASQPGAASAAPSPSSPASAMPSPRASGTTPAGTAPAGTAPAGIAPAGTESPAPPASRPDVGVRLPGGWVPIPLAAGLIAAAAVVWLRRRHRYVPGNLAGPVLTDPDLRPLPPALTVLRRGVRRQAPDLLPATDPSSAPDQRPAPARPASAMGDAGDSARGPAEHPPVTGQTQTAELPPIGPSGPDLAGLASPLPTGGLGLVGDGAHAVARAMLVATLSSGSPEDPDARGQVVIPADALTTLLGVDAVNLAPTPRLTVTATLGEALTRLEELLIERRRTLQDEDADDLQSMRAADPMHPPMPPVLLLAEVPGPETRARLTTTLHLGTPLQINAVLLGEWPRGDTLDVDAKGYLDTECRVESGGRLENDTTDRLAVLDTTTTLHLLQMLAEAHTGRGTSNPTAPPVPEPVDPSTMDNPDRSQAPPEPDLAKPDLPGIDSPELGNAQERTQATTPIGPTPTVPPRDDATPTPTVATGTNRARVPVRVLGRPALVSTGASGQGLRRRAQELLVYLVVHRAGADLPDIKEAFWPDASNRRAGERLQTEVGDLRGRIRDAYRALGTNSDPDKSSPGEQVQPVVNTGGRYHLNPNLIEVDWWTVQDALAAATTDTAHRREHLRRAVDAFHGPLAHGCGYDWLPEVEEHVRRQGIIAYTQLAQLVADTDPAEAAGLLDRATALDPYNEDLARRAMRAHARLGDADAVRAQLHRIRAALDELDLEPDEQTTTLATELLRRIPGVGHHSIAQPTNPNDP